MLLKNTLIFIVHLLCTAVLVKGVSIFCPYFSICYYASIVDWITGFLIAVFTFKFIKKNLLNERLSPKNKAVLITGCDTGFGHLLAKHLDSKGFIVFAGCLFPNGNGACQLKEACSKNLKIIKLDVTKDEDVKQAKEFVMENLGEAELWAIVNNAGILRGLSIETTRFQDFIDSLEVNTLGVVRVTQAFLPLLRKSKGRVVNITSMAGRTKFTFMAPYYMSKHAAVAFNDCLRREMEDWGVKVISIEPDFFATQLVNNELVNKTIDQTISFVPDDIRSDYGENYLNSFKTTKNYFFCFKGSNTNTVINDIDSAITLKYPDIIYEPRASYFTAIASKIYMKLPYELKDLFIRIFQLVLRFPKPITA